MPVKKYMMDGVFFPIDGFHRADFIEVANERISGTIADVKFSEDGRGVDVFSSSVLSSQDVGILDAVAKFHKAKSRGICKCFVTVSDLPADGVAGEMAFASDGLKHGEVTGGGTGVPVYFSNGHWRRYSDDTEVMA